MPANSETDPTDSLTYEEMQKQLDNRRRDILTTLSAADGHTANTSEIRDRAGIPSGSMDHYMRQFERWELIERVNQEFVGQGGEAIVWRLTERGEEFCKDRLSISPDSLVRPSDFEEMDERVEELQRKTERMDDEIQSMKRVIVKIAVQTGTLSEDQASELLEKQGSERS